MTDYIKDIPNGTMMIRDTGGWVEFWFKTGSSTWNNEQGWGYDIGGGYVGGTFRLARGGGWQMFGRAYVDTRRNVMFRINGSGLGWSTTDHWAFIERARIPDPPGVPYFGEVTSTQIHVAFDYGYDGGMGIDAAEIWYSDDPNWAKWVVGGRDAWVGGLNSGGEYFFWGKVHNAMGWSGLSGRSSRRTLRVPDSPTPVELSDVQQTSVRTHFTFNGRWDGGTPVREWQIGYGLDPNSPQTLVSGVDLLIGNLQPGKRYYFWSRGRNDIGWGPWSARSEVLLIAGAWINASGVQKRALAWVKVGGVWKLARPWTKAGGTWRNVSS